MKGVISNSQNLLVGHVHDVIFKLQATYLYSQVWLTSAGRLIFRPIPCSLTCTSAVSHQVVACITTVGGCLFKCCSIGITNLAIGSVIQRTTVYSCWMKVELLHDVHCIANVLLSELTGLQLLHCVWVHLTAGPEPAILDWYSHWDEGWAYA